MRRFLLVLVCSVGASSGAFSAAQNVSGPTESSAEAAEAEVVLTELSPPVYPPLARQAQIAGDVKLRVLIRRDGSIETAEVITGHLMLKAAALESVRKSTFECHSCGDTPTSYSLTYSFGFSDEGCKEVVQERRVRSAKCAYLWKCGLERTTSWGITEYRVPGVTNAPGHVTILVSSECLQTEDSRSK
jgi:TonB family protein